MVVVQNRNHFSIVFVLIKHAVTLWGLL